MAKYTVTFSCGHTDTVDLVGKHTERNRRLEWLSKNGSCKDCYREEQRAKGPLFWARPVADGCEVICYQNSFEIKGDLAALGFTFRDEVWGPDDRQSLLSLRMPRKGWHRIYRRESESDSLALDQISAFIAERGYPFEIKENYSILSSAFASIVEGRPDLVPQIRRGDESVKSANGENEKQGGAANRGE